LLEECQLVQGLGVYERKAFDRERFDGQRRIAEISFARWAADLGFAFPFVAVASRIQLETLLRAALARHRVKVRDGWRLAVLEQGTARTRVLLERLGRESTGYATLHTELVVEKSEELEPSFVIGTEGRTVPVYRQLGIELEELGKRTTYAVLDGKRAKEAPSEPENARLVHGDQTEAAFWPRRNDGLRCIVDLGTLDVDAVDSGVAARGIVARGAAVALGAEPINAQTEELVALSGFEPGRLTTLLAERAPWLEARAGGLEPRTLFSMQARLASELGRGRIWLAGPAAHSGAPLAAQSSNGGLREAARLTELFAGALTREEPLHALEDYNRQSLRQWQQLLADPQPGADVAPLRATLERMSAGLVASLVEREALLAQL
jgi:2-polyprenyl-6-methoxyphenol hydroxylase-like FAD-dependent oxidoreductase